MNRRFPNLYEHAYFTNLVYCYESEDHFNRDTKSWLFMIDETFSYTFNGMTEGEFAEKYGMRTLTPMCRGWERVKALVYPVTSGSHEMVWSYDEEQSDEVSHCFVHRYLDGHVTNIPTEPGDFEIDYDIYIGKKKSVFMPLLGVQYD